MSEFDDALKDAEMNFVPSLMDSQTGEETEDLLTEIDNDLSGIDGSVCGDREKIEQLKIFESVL